jgi:hypothetical protein
VAACDRFIYTEILNPQQDSTIQDEQAQEPLEPMISTAVTATAQDDGWAPLSSVGFMILKNNPSFDTRNYGCQKLGELVRKQDYLEVKEVPVGDGSTNVHLYVRLKAV